MNETLPPPEGAQETFLSHLVELRTRLVRSIVAVVIVLLACSRARRTSTRCSPRRCCTLCPRARR